MDVKIKPGIYTHFKGKEYKVFGVAINSESYEDLVVYQEMFGNNEIWARPLTMFTATVLKDGKEEPRFAFVREFKQGENSFE